MATLCLERLASGDEHVQTSEAAQGLVEVPFEWCAVALGGGFSELALSVVIA